MNHVHVTVTVSYESCARDSHVSHMNHGYLVIILTLVLYEFYAYLVAVVMYMHTYADTQIDLLYIHKNTGLDKHVHLHMYDD